MSEDNSDNGNDNAGNRPSHLAYQVRDAEEGKSYFNKVGAAWEHGDGQGYNIQLDSVPVDGRVTLRTPQERLDELRSDTQAQPEPEKDQGHER